MEEIIKLIDERLKVIKCRHAQHIYNCGDKDNILDLKYIKELRSEKNFLESLKELIKENKK